MNEPVTRIARYIRIRREYVFTCITGIFLIFVDPQIAFQKFEKGVNPTKTSSYNLRPLMWESGSTVSNKVLECLVLRFAKNRILTSECFIMAMVRLHLAHGKIAKYWHCNTSKPVQYTFAFPERYHSLDTKMSKGNPLSLEEVCDCLFFYIILVNNRVITLAICEHLSFLLQLILMTIYSWFRTHRHDGDT